MREYFEYKGIRYGVGTQAIINIPFYGTHLATYCREGYSEWWEYTGMVVPFNPLWQYPSHSYIVEIVKPVFYDKQTNGPLSSHSNQTNNRMPPPEWDVAIGWVWYILVIAVGSIFKDRIGIWAMATAYFFLWKNGFFNRKGKK